MDNDAAVSCGGAGARLGGGGDGARLADGDAILAAVGCAGALFIDMAATGIGADTVLGAPAALGAGGMWGIFARAGSCGGDAAFVYAVRSSASMPGLAGLLLSCGGG